MSVSAEIADAAPQTERSPNECLDMIGGRLELVARMGDQDNDTVLFRTQMPPGQVVPLHGHADPECFYVLAGRLEIFLLDEAPQWRVLPAGRSVLVANGIRHAIRNPASESADLVVATNNRLAQFFRECGRPAQPGKDFMPAGPEDIERLVRTAQAYGYWLSSPEEHAALTGRPGQSR